MAQGRVVELYVYDLSQGLARQFSVALLGTYIDAVFHTSIVIGSNEYYYGQGIQCSVPGRTHHGAPMEKISLGHTSLPDDVIVEYLESLKSIYSPEAYDLFMHNCNNFSNDLSVFLTGNPIPAHITSLPATVLQTPFGQMLRPQLERAMRPITQAPTVSRSTQLPSHSTSTAGSVRNARNLGEFENILKSAENGCAVVFFTSAGCPPCRIISPVFEELAAGSGSKAVFIKVDVGVARDIGSKYTISATPTFMSFSRGEKFEEWKGANQSDLRTKVNTLIQVTYPAHHHAKLDFPYVSSISMAPRMFPKVPPIDKVKLKLGDRAADPVLSSIMRFLEARNRDGAIEAPLPSLDAWPTHLSESLSNAPVEELFPIIDLYRAALVDARVSGCFFEEQEHRSIRALITYVNEKGTACPYPLRLVTLQLVCNLFSSTLFPPAMCTQPFCGLLTSLMATSLLDTAHTATREAAASLAFNIAAYAQKQRNTGKEVLEEGDVVELFVSVLEAIQREGEGKAPGSKEALKGLLLTVFLLVYCVPEGSELLEVMTALEAGEVVRGKKGKIGSDNDDKLVEEVARLCSVRA